MNKDVKAKWVRALRSGAYKQSKSVMAKSTPKGDTFCCLGVLTNLYCIEKKEGFDDILKDEMYTSYLPKKVKQWSSLRIDTQRFLAGLNDEGYSFIDIADNIEKIV